MQNNSLQAEREALADETRGMYLNFTIGGELYGIEVHYVLQIIGMQRINRMPDMPHGMKGFISLRGSVISIYSLHARFGKDEPDYTERTCIIVITIGSEPVGLIVDAIQEAVTIEPDSISPPPSMGIAEANRYVSGIAQLPDGQTVLLLDTPRLIA